MFPRIRKHLLYLTLPLLLAGLMPARVNAWGPSGHRIVGLVAAEHLTPRARQRVEELLGGETLADVANWADAVRDDRPETARMHFVNLPRTATAFSRSRDCADVGGNPGCAVTAIEKYRAILSGTAAGDRAEALKFIVHFVGDMHQPLHVSFADDRGGNNIRVRFFGRSSNLHKVWDSGIIGRADLSDADFAAALEAELWEQSGGEEVEIDEATRRRIEQKIERMQGGRIDDWTNDSFALAKSNAYDRVATDGSARLGLHYYEGILGRGLKPNWLVVDEQLTKAGIRLAKILNDALGG